MPLPGYARGAVMPGDGLFITRKTFEDIENFIRDNKASVVKINQGLDLLAQLMVYVVRSEAMKRSFGPVAPRRRSVASLANRIPVQRITGAYYAGWQVRRLGPSHWLVFNDTFEAILVETGMYQRVRRPVLKLSLISMLEFVSTTRVADRFFDTVLAPRRSARGTFQSFEERIKPLIAQNIAGPQGRLP